MKKSTFWILAGAVAAGGVLLYVYHAQAATPAVPPLPPGGGSDHVTATSGGQLNTRQAQTILKAIGVYGASTDMNSAATLANLAPDQQLALLGVDGGWGTQTQSAVSLYQQTYGLPVTGQVDAATAASLLAAYRSLGGS